MSWATPLQFARPTRLGWESRVGWKWEMAPQTVETIEFAPGIGMAPQGLNPQYIASRTFELRPERTSS
jgi:hypothetical protein